jgi:NAD(P)-dependent dehydrogenase (short-subunit alcohol dehydrogenase family)
MSREPFIDFQGKKIILTGVFSELGRSIAGELSHYGASLVLVGRDKEELAGAGGGLEPGGHDVLLMDLGDPASIVPAIKEFARQHGRIYGMCHAAQADEASPLSSAEAETVRSILDMNLVAGIELARGVTRRDVMETSGGSILFVSSIAALVGVAGRVGYSASHGGISAAARSMAVELARRKIRVNTISPGLVDAGMAQEVRSRFSDTQIRDIVNTHPLGIGQCRDVARAVAFLLAPQSSWITGTDLVVDGGYTAQ